MALHRSGTADMRISLAGWLSAWLGGPKDWCNQLRPCLIRLHPSLPIYADVHAQWPEATRRAPEPSAIGPQFVAQLRQYLTQIADAMAAR
ncbi:hypothetical protein [Mesorhizobium japonicum]|uniref:Uncharacterized protein n=2 Tax=Mesorhizobium TaxID=68287 RepID=A0A3M9X3Q0_9HYPH|nr:hypothetical protein DNR46_26345 [Mesorhizobium japonicum]